MLQVSNSLVSDYFPEATAGSETTVSSGNVAHGTGAILVAGAIVGALLLVIILALSVIYYLRRRICIVAGKGQPVTVFPIRIKRLSMITATQFTYYFILKNNTLLQIASFLLYSYIKYDLFRYCSVCDQENHYLLKGI